MAPDAMLVVDASGRIVQANALAEALFGYPQGNLASQPLDLLIPGRFRESHRGHAEGLFRRPQHRPMDAGPVLWGLRRDGSEFAAQISLRPLESPGGMRVLAAIRDVSEHRRNQAALEQATTDLERQVAVRSAELLQANGELPRQIAEREQAETALRQAEAQYRQLVENQPDLICRTDGCAQTARQPVRAGRLRQRLVLIPPVRDPARGLPQDRRRFRRRHGGEQPARRPKVAAINQTSHTLGIRTIAEHAHSREIVDGLRELGVDYAQGFFLGRPAPWGEIRVP